MDARFLRLHAPELPWATVYIMVRFPPLSNEQLRERLQAFIAARLSAGDLALGSSYLAFGGGISVGTDIPVPDEDFLELSRNFADLVRNEGRASAAARIMQVYNGDEPYLPR